MFSLVLVTENIFFLFFQMDLPVPNSASPSSLLMWVNFPPAPRKNVFPVPPGTDWSFKQDKASFGAENWSLQGVRLPDRISARGGECLLGTGNPFGHCNLRLGIDLCWLLPEIPAVFGLFFVRLALVKVGNVLGLRMEVLY